MKSRALLLLLLVPAAGCVAPALPQGQGTSSLTVATLATANELYFYPDRLDRRVVIGALDALERRFDPVRFHADPGASHGVLFVGDARARWPLLYTIPARSGQGDPGIFGL